MKANGKKIGVIGVPGGWSTEQLLAALRQRTGYAEALDPSALNLDLIQGRVLHKDLDLASLDGLVVKKLGVNYSPELLERLEFLSFLNAQGLPVFSRPASIGRVLDRLTCTTALRLAGIPIPPTLVAQDLDQALAALVRLGNCVLKPLYTSKARGMCLVRPGPEAAPLMEDFLARHRFLYLQQWVDLAGQDLGLVFLGGRYLGAYARTERFQANSGLDVPTGGRYLACKPGTEVVELARRAQALFSLDFTCVDVAETSQGPMVFEVSAFGGFRGLWETEQIDAAGLYADYVLQRLKE